MTETSAGPSGGGRDSGPPTVVVVSRTLESLDAGQCRTSSQLFELRFARAMAPWARVSILSLALQASDQEDGDVRLHRLTPGRAPVLLRLLATVHRSHLLAGPRPWIIFFGYSPVMYLTLRIVALWRRARVAAFVFDTHTSATVAMTGAKRALATWYFRTGVRLLLYSDALLLLNPRAIEPLRAQTIPTLVTAVGADQEIPVPDRRPSTATYLIAYAGSFESYNGVLELIDAVRSVPDPTLRLEVLGSGSLLARVERAAAPDPRIVVRGRVAHTEAEETLSAADLLVCLRDLSDPVSSFSFPSKLVECLASGVPVIASPVVDTDEFRAVVEVVDSLDPASIATAIQRCLQHPEQAQARAVAARRYVLAHHDWRQIGLDVVTFLESVPRDRRYPARLKR